jgi:hypothetical protein
MKLSGNLIKMRTDLNNPVRYFLRLGDDEIQMNPLIGKEISFHHNGVINCINCGKRTNKSYSQGFCYNCVLTAPEADESVIRPELSRAHLGIARDLEWAMENDLIDHFVYLSVTSDLKVGVTRFHQMYTRWIDQGAVMAIKLARTPNRHIAGIIEVFLKKYVADKTSWSKMLKGDIAGTYNLVEEKERLAGFLPGELKNYIDNDNTVVEINYPVSLIPDTVSQIGFDNNDTISGKLTGIKGQYLIFGNGKVFNIRKHNGYFTEFGVLA